MPMRCTKCKFENPAGMQFCGKCRAALVLTCPNCSFENPPEFDFCGKCAAALSRESETAHDKSVAAKPVATVRIGAKENLPELDGERKTVTAFFADIKGSTELMEDLDPEEARAIIDPALKLMIDAVRRYDGYVVQSTGDGIFALFGAPIAHEDHPQRALYAALRLQEEMSRYSAKVIADGGMPIEARVGVNTGEVVVRSISTGAGQTEYTPIGHTTNLAARMQAVAPTGSIAISAQTRKFVEGYFALKPLGPTRVKGVAEPVKVYEVTGLGPLRTRLQRSVGRGLTKFVGREREMELLRHAGEQAKSGHGQIVAAMAEAGVGKSRLFYEFKVTSQSDWMVLETFSVSHGKASAYLPVLDLLHGYFEITAEDDNRRRRQKILGKLLELDRALEDAVPYLYALLGIVEGEDPLAQMDGQVKKRRTLEAIKRIVLRESLNQPLMVIFEDVHWIDEHTQQFLNLIADSLGTAKILLLVNYRPEYSHRWDKKQYYTLLRLDPLGKDSAEQMLAVLLGDGRDLDALKRLIIERTEGTPFFIEEIVQSLFEDGVLQRVGTVKLVKSMNAVKVPATVQGVLAARIDRLSAEDKELVQILAVLGREFPLGLVKRVTLGPDDELERELSGLQTGEFIYEQPAVGDTEYTFKHALTQEVAYNSILTERRKLIHERAGRALEELFAGQLDDHFDELAHHYSRSDNFEKAVEYLVRAGQQALQRSAYADAIGNLGAAKNLLQKLPDSRERIQRELLIQLAVGPALMAVKGWAGPEVEQAYTRARELCDRLGDPPELFSTLFGLRTGLLFRGELSKAYELSEQLLRLAQSGHDPAQFLYAHSALGNTCFWMGKFSHARENLERAISVYDPDHHRSLAFRYFGVDAKASCLSYGTWTLWLQGYPDQALAKGNEALALAQALSHPFSVAWVEYYLGGLRQLRREVHAAQEHAEIGITLGAEYGFGQFLASATILRGWALAAQGRRDEGIVQIREGLAASSAIRLEPYRPYSLCSLAEACTDAGRFDEGLAALNEALQATDKNEIRFYEAETNRLKGELLLRQAERSGAEQTSPLGTSETAEAQSCFERATEIARQQNAKSWELRATISLARLLKRRGDAARAREILTDIYNWFTEGFDTADLKDAKALLEELST
jgi:predicted ATPase/class 3 adenylate cyclase